MNLAVILLRGLINSNRKIKETCKHLNLGRKHVCVVIEDNSVNKGMIKRIKDYVTWGEIDSEVEKELIKKRGTKTPEGKLKPFFRLAPPRGGFERKGIKKSFKQGGALGYRGKEIGKLIKKML